MSTLQYRCETDDAPISGVIHLSDQSPWTTLLGTMPLPAAGAIEDLNETLSCLQANLRLVCCRLSGFAASGHLRVHLFRSNGLLMILSQDPLNANLLHGLLVYSQIVLCVINQT